MVFSIANLTLLDIPDVPIMSDLAAQLALLFCGALGILSLFIFLVFSRTRDRIYLYYLLFLVFCVLEAAFYTRDFITARHLIQAYEGNNARWVEFFTLMAYSAYCLFSIMLMDIRKQSRKLFYWILTMAFSGFVYGLLFILFKPGENESALNLAFLISRAIILSMSLVALFWIIFGNIRSTVKTYFIWGSCFYFIGALTGTVRGLFPNIPWSAFYAFNSETYFQAGILLEVIFFTFALSYRVYIYYEERQQNQLRVNTIALSQKDTAQAEALALRIQINPHFLFNYLNLLKYYIQIEENKKATKYLVKFSQFIRRVIDLNELSVIPLIDEINLVEQYISLEKVRFGEELHFDFLLDKGIDYSKVEVPPMLLQPMIEEALWRGRQKSSGETRYLKLSVKAIQEQIFINIEEAENDNTKALAESSRFNQAVSHQITLERINLFNKIHPYHISLINYNREELQTRHLTFKCIVKIELKNPNN